MALPKLTKPELQIMEALWSLGPCSIREIHEYLKRKVFEANEPMTMQ